MKLYNGPFNSNYCDKIYKLVEDSDRPLWYYLGSREENNPVENNRISVEFVLRLADDVAHIGTSFSVGAAVEIGDSQIWAGQTNVTAVAKASVNMVGDRFRSVNSQ